MFVQVIRGTVSDEAAMVKAMDRWDAELRPGATGFLGTTAGVTSGGEAIAIARFESEEAARRNSDRPEQGAWWADFEKSFTGAVDFHESSDVDLLMGGGADDAGFVQVMRGRAEPTGARAVMADAERILAVERPDILGGLTAWHSDGTFTDVAYFRSEAEARAAETKEMSAEAQDLFQRFSAALPVDEYLDLSTPIIR